jgi:hypothetical protein
MRIMTPETVQKVALMPILTPELLRFGLPSHVRLAVLFQDEVAEKVGMTVLHPHHEPENVRLAIRLQKAGQVAKRAGDQHCFVCRFNELEQPHNTARQRTQSNLNDDTAPKDQRSVLNQPGSKRSESPCRIVSNNPKG